MTERWESQEMAADEYIKRIRIPEFEDFERAGNESNTELSALWEQNHEALKEIVQRFKIPFFGLHGTSLENLRKIEKNNDETVEIATFYAQPEDPDTFLSSLYIMASYCIHYGFFKHKGKEGSIGIFSLEEKGRNATFAWEPLKFLPFNSLGSDGENMNMVKENVEKCLQEVMDHPQDENYLKKKGVPFRSGLSNYLGKYSYSGVFKGAYTEGSEKFRKDLVLPEEDVLAKEILRLRFWMQDILKNVFEKLSLSPK